jgi:hypothetical protein
VISEKWIELAQDRVKIGRFCTRGVELLGALSSVLVAF